MFKRVLVAVLLVVALAVSVQPSSAAVTWKLSHHKPVGSDIDKDMKQLAADIEKETEGRIKVKVFPAGQLGSSEMAIERTSMGTIDLMYGYPNSEIDPALDVYALPGMVMDYVGVEKLYSQGSPFSVYLESLFNKQDLHVLATYTMPFAALWFKTMPENDPKDPNVSHKEKIRVPGINSYRYPAEAFGYFGTALPFGEVFTALQTGVIDGVYGPSAESAYQSLRDVVKVYIPVNLQPDMNFVLVNKNSFEKLSEQDRKIVAEVGLKLEQAGFARGAEKAAMWDKRVKDYGITTVELTTEERAAFQKRAQEYAWPKLREDIGGEEFDKAVAAYEASVE